jgi:hypothetical protein
MDILLKTRVKSITLETDASGHEVEKVLLMLDKSATVDTPAVTMISGVYLIVEFNKAGRGALHVGQELDLNVSMSIPGKT